MKRKNFTSHRPHQLLKEKEKTRDWAMDTMDYFISQFGPDTDELTHAYDLFAGERDDTRFDHLTKTFGIEYPEAVKHFPLVRPLLEQLAGEEWKRKLNFTVRTEDVDSIKEKDGEKKQAILQAYQQELERSSQEGAQNIEHNLAKLKKYFERDFKSSQEIAAFKVLKALMEKQRIKEKSAKMFLDQMIGGREFYQVKVRKANVAPDCDVLDPRDVRYSGDDDIDWVRDAGWVVRRMRMSATEVLDRWGSQMTADEVKSFSEQYEIFDRHSRKIDNPGDLDRMAGSVVSDDEVDIHYVEWKSLREVRIDEDWADHSSTELPNQKARRVKRGYVQDLWCGYRIGEDIYTDIGKYKFATRSFSNPSKVNLTINGRVNSHRSGKPYSLVLATNDLQELYDVLHFHKANLIALSGVKGTHMDISQLPDFGEEDDAGNMKMWMYYKKLGVAWIESNKESVKSDFNQFTPYDDTLGAGLDAILASITHLEDMAGRIIGVNRQRLGAMSNTDGKAVTEDALIQSSMNTEPIFKEHYLTVQEMLVDLLNAARFAYKDGATMTYIAGDYGAEVFQAGAEWALADFGVVLGSLVSEERMIGELRALANQLVANQMIGLKDLLKLFRSDSLREIELELEEASTRREEEQMKQQQQAAQQQQQQAQAEQQAKAAEVAHKQQIDNRKAALEEKKAADEAEFKRQELLIKEKQLDLERKELEHALAQPKGTSGAGGTANRKEVKNL